MPNSPKCIVKRLYHNGSISEHERDKLLKALEQEPCEDCVSRQVISDYVEGHIQEINTGYGDLNEHTNRILRMIMEYIDKLPSVTPTKKKGKWLEQDDDWESFYFDCSVCGESWTTIEGTPWNNGMRYCPNCGAEMVEPHESEE